MFFRCLRRGFPGRIIVIRGLFKYIWNLKIFPVTLVGVKNEPLLVPKWILLQNRLQERIRLRCRRHIHVNFGCFVRNTTITRIVADLLHDLRRFDAVDLSSVHADNGRDFQLFADALFELAVSGLVLVDVVNLGLLLLHAEEPRRIEIDKKRLRLLVELDDIGRLAIRTLRLQLLHKLVLKPENRLIVFLRRRRILEIEHRIPFGNG